MSFSSREAYEIKIQSLDPNDMADVISITNAAVNANQAQPMIDLDEEKGVVPRKVA